MANNYALLKLIMDAGEYRLSDIALRLAAKNEGLFLELASEAGLDVPATTVTVGLDQYTILPHQMAKMKEAYAPAGGGYNKVAAIKVARDVMGPAPGVVLGLKDAKDLVEHLMEAGYLPKPPPVDPYARSYADPDGRPYDSNDPLRPRW